MTTLYMPCIINCCLNDDDIFCSIEEILQWSDLATTSKQKQQILRGSTERKHDQHQPMS